jgi:hypothetical protein
MSSVETYAADVVHAFLIHVTKDVFYTCSDMTDFLLVCCLVSLSGVLRLPRSCRCCLLELLGLFRLRGFGIRFDFGFWVECLSSQRS